jgi:cytochrome bd-type quinol oxidase subunit 2
MEPNAASRKPILIWLIVSQILALLSLVFWLLAAGLSVMAFDSGVTQEAWNLVIAVWAYPIWPILFTIAAWIAYARKKDKLAAVLTTLTFLPVLILLLVIVFSSLFYSFQL